MTATKEVVAEVEADKAEEKVEKEKSESEDMSMGGLFD